MMKHLAKPLPDEGSRISAVIRRFEFVCEIPIAELVGRSQAARITELRHMLMYIIREVVPEASYSAIGRSVGGRDMATVHEAVQKVFSKALKDPAYALRLERTIAAVRRLGPDPSPKPWQLLAALAVLQDEGLTDAEARKAATGLLQQLEVTHG
jgi:hypothetical protein